MLKLTFVFIILVSFGALAQSKPNTANCVIECIKLTPMPTSPGSNGMGYSLATLANQTYPAKTFEECQIENTKMSNMLLQSLCPSQSNPPSFVAQQPHLKCSYSWKKIKISDSKYYSCF